MTFDPAANIENRLRERANAEGVRVREQIARFTQTRAVAELPVPAPPPPPVNATDALFRQWDAEDAAMIPEEQEAEARFWEAFGKGINADRVAAKMRPVF